MLAEVAELLFETYQAPGAAYGIDSVFSTQFNCGGHLPHHGIIVSGSHSASHVLPVVEGKVDFHNVKRLDVGGRSMTDFMMQLVHLQHPPLRSYVTPIQAEELKHRFCYLTAMQEYSQVVAHLSNSQVDAIQLPFTPISVPSHAELMQKAAARREQGLRLQELSAKRRQEKMVADRLRLAKLVQLRLKESHATVPERKAAMLEEGFKTEAHLTKAIDELADRVSAAQHKANAGTPDALTDEKLYPLLNASDKGLSSQQITEKQVQVALKTSTERRQKVLAKREEARAKHVEQQHQLTKLRNDDPEKWKASIKAELETLRTRQERRRKHRQDLNDRSSVAYRRRQKMINDAANEGSADDDFGANDDDWLVYHQMVPSVFVALAFVYILTKMWSVCWSRCG